MAQNIPFMLLNVFLRDFYPGPKNFGRWDPKIICKAVCMCVLVLFLRRGSTVVRKFSNHSMKQRLFSFIQWLFLSACCFLGTSRSWTTTESVSWPPTTTDVSICFLFHVLNKLSVCTCMYIFLGASQSSSLEFLFLLFSVKALGLGTLCMPDECYNT